MTSKMDPFEMPPFKEITGASPRTAGEFLGCVSAHPEEGEVYIAPSHITTIQNLGPNRAKVSLVSGGPLLVNHPAEDIIRMLKNVRFTGVGNENRS